MATKPTSPLWDSGNALASGCVRYWFADATNTTTIIDYSPSAKNLTWTGTPGSATAPGGVGTEYALTGSQYATGLDTSMPSGAGAWTVAAWVKTSVSLSNSTVQVVATWGAGGGNGKALTFCQSNFSGSGAQYKANTFSLSPQGSFQTGNTAINDGNWHRVVATYNGSRVSFYLDGVLDRSDSSGDVALNVVLGATLYFAYDGGSPKWNGSIGDVVVWNRALNSTEIASDYTDPWQQLRGTGALTAGNISRNGTETVTTYPLVCTSAAGGTSPYTYQWQRSAYGAASWSNVSGATSLTLTDTGLSSGTPYDYRVRVTDSASTVAYSSTFSAQTLFPVDNAYVHLTPIGWLTVGSSPAARAVTNNTGSAMSFGFTGTSAAVVCDTTNNSSSVVGAAAVVDYGANVALTLSSAMTLGSGLASGTHSAILWHNSRDATYNCWNLNGSYPDNVLAVLGIRLDVGSTLAAGPAWLTDKTLCIGDSLTIGSGAGQGAGTITVTDSRFSFAQVAADALGSEAILDGFGGSGYTTTTGANVPPLNSRIGYRWSGQARTLSGLKRVLLMYGVNDGNGSYGSTVATCLTTLRAAVGASVPVYVLVPFQGTGRTSVTAGFTSYQGTTTSHALDGTATYLTGANDAKTYLIDFGSDAAGFSATGLNSYDGTHYSDHGARKAGAKAAWAVARIEAAAGGGGVAQLVTGGLVR